MPPDIKAEEEVEQEGYNLDESNADLFATYQNEQDIREDPGEEAEDANEFGMPSPGQDGEKEEEEEEEEEQDDQGQYDDLETPQGASGDEEYVPRLPPLDDPCGNEDDAHEDEGGKDDFDL